MSYQFLDLGFSNYYRTYQLQRKIWDSNLKYDSKGIVILTEHDHVFTLGRSNKASDTFIDRQRLIKDNIEFYQVERGGDVTYHGPGQLVLYPILNLKYRKKDLRAFVNDLEEVMILFLRHVGVNGFRKEGFRGVWTASGKIASVGVAIKKWISFHGIAININPNMEYFSYIKPCGLDSKVMTSLFAILGEKVFQYNLKQILRQSFEQVFN